MPSPIVHAYGYGLRNLNPCSYAPGLKRATLRLLPSPCTPWVAANHAGTHIVRSLWFGWAVCVLSSRPSCTLCMLLPASFAAILGFCVCIGNPLNLMHTDLNPTNWYSTLSLQLLPFTELMGKNTLYPPGSGSATLRTWLICTNCFSSLPHLVFASKCNIVMGVGYVMMKGSSCSERIVRSQLHDTFHLPRRSIHELRSSLLPLPIHDRVSLAAAFGVRLCMLIYLLI
ncbi:hypothetical protein BKA70DRAFT_40051 [Coprinopsis sp. MPI-PUGE-AT-0042]|nr:hypothetical protein BKA70DRAFT_40051 [Coprinopsis sp. MPI-PUGE-AT-0042]